MPGDKTIDQLQNDLRRFRDLLAGNEARQGSEVARRLELSIAGHDARWRLGLRGASKSQAELQRVDAALARIESGAFGICAHCMLEIELERLNADPATPFCAVCFEELSQRRQQVRRHR